MKVAVTGATGFVGRHVTQALLERGHEIVALARNREKAKKMPWFDEVTFIDCDLQRDYQVILAPAIKPEALVHLAWSGLPHYNNFLHIRENLPADLAFLTAVVEAGVGQILVTGTCLEYGLKHGPLAEDGETSPTTPYGLAKDVLRKALQLLQAQTPFNLQWVRLFYMYGEGQNPKSILAQLDAAIAAGHSVFNMSAGNQLRDYLPIDAVAETIAKLLEVPSCNGVINCCSGQPVSIYDLVTAHCIAKGSNIKLNRGYYPYPNYEPLAFWGQPTKLNELSTFIRHR